MKNKKSLLLDLYKLNNIHSGLGQFSFNLYQSLMEIPAPDIEYHFLLPRKPENMEIKGIPHKVNLGRRYFKFLNPKVDLWHSLHQFPSHFPPPGTMQLLTIHDLNFLKEKEEAKAMRYLNRLQQNVNRADYLSTISYYSRKEIEKHLHIGNKKIEVIYPGVKAPDKGHMLEPSLKPEQPFFFSIGIFSAKKNFHKLVEMMNYLENHQLIIAGDHQTAYGQKVKKIIADRKLENRVILSGKISEKEKSWYYHHCEAFLFPSYAEGFGMPPIEAMLCGKPVFLSREASLPEVGGNMAFYWNNLQDRDMAEMVKYKLRQLENKPDFGFELKSFAGRYNWQECSQNYLNIYKGILFNNQ